MSPSVFVAVVAAVVLVLVALVPRRKKYQMATAAPAPSIGTGMPNTFLLRRPLMSTT